MSTIMVTGADGQLGAALRRQYTGTDFIFLSRRDLDLSQTENLAQTLRRYDFDGIVNCAAYTAVDQAEDDVETAMKVNAEAVRIIAEVCLSKNAYLFHLSTDYVFDGKGSQPVKEDHPLNPMSVYGTSKMQGEQSIRNILTTHCILRTSWLYDAYGKNFLNTMLRLGKTNSELRIVYDQIGTPTYAVHLANTILSLIEQCRHDTAKFQWGTYHYSNSGVSSWYDFAHAIFKLAEIPIKLVPILSEHFPAKASRPCYSVLNKEKIRNTFGIAPQHWQDALKECIDSMKTNQSL